MNIERELNREYPATTTVGTKFRNILRHLEMQGHGTPTLIIGDYEEVAIVMSPPTVTSPTAIDKRPPDPENTDVTVYGDDG